jgi:hypothetical protein
MARNPLAKSRKVGDPFATFYVTNNQTGVWFEWQVLKTYQLPKNEEQNPYARWLCAVKSPYTHGSYEMGDVYIDEILRTGAAMIQSTPEWREAYEKKQKV